MYYSRVQLNDKLAEALSKGLLNKKIEEPVALDEEFEILEENLGNLNFITNKKLMKSFVGYDKKLSAGIGADSEVEEISFKNSGNLEKAIFETDDVVGFVICVDDWKNQIMSVSRKDFYSYYFSKKYSAKTQAGLVKNTSFKYNPKSATTNVFDNMLLNTYLKSKGLTFPDDLNRAQQSMVSGIGSAKKVLNALIVFARENGLDLGAKVIKLDKVRAKKRMERFEAKAGAIALIDPKELGKQFASELRSKLEVLKNSKVKDVGNSIEDVQKILEGAYPEKFVYNGLTFDFYRANYIDNAIQAKITKSNMSYEPYLEYQLNKASDETRYELRNKIRAEFDAEFGKMGDASEEAINNYMETVKQKAPNSIKAFVEVTDNFSIKVKKIELSGY